jgi:hypothetical protein
LNYPNDDAELACAVATRAVLVVSRDNDLLSLGSFDGIPVVLVAKGVKGLGSTARPHARTGRATRIPACLQASRIWCAARRCRNAEFRANISCAIVRTQKTCRPER